LSSLQISSGQNWGIMCNSEERVLCRWDSEPATH
jgi:hypothetical protein